MAVTFPLHEEPKVQPVDRKGKTMMFDNSVNLRGGEGPPEKSQSKSDRLRSPKEGTILPLRGQWKMGGIRPGAE